ncbi:DUF4351 domain-containing protein [Aliinostoc sp. HNIBRCY26]|uniref:DUF4351 domain-containing protein n=1 Tax=Aliinostoc sp. HNIBRCY26 TaxID=3418997 RepID=UPI003D050A8F
MIKVGGAEDSLINRQLTKRFGELPQQTSALIAGLPLPVLAQLGEAWLDFNSVADLQAWLQERTS